MLIPDVNLLIYSHNRASPLFERANRWWVDTLRGESTVLLPWVVISGFIRISCSPKALVSPLSIEEATEIAEQWLAQPTVSVIEPGRDHLRILKELSASSGIPGSKLTDLQIAALALEHRATVHTHDRDFLRIRGVKLHFPLE